MLGHRVLVPVDMKQEALEVLHLGHQGFNKCRDRANFSLWWPGITQDIRDKLERCKI